MKILKRLLPIIFILILWGIGSLFTKPLFLPSPIKVFNTFISLLQNGMLVKGFVYSFIRISIATLLSMSISVILSILIMNSKVIDDLMTPITNFLRYLPITAFYPLLMMWCGINERMKISFLFLATFVYFLPTLVLTMKDIDQNLIDTALTIGVKKYQLVYRIILPYCLPVICKTYLMMYGIGWTYIVIAETVNAKFGLGHLINVATSRGRTDQVFVVLIIIILFSYLFDTLCSYVIEKIFKWKYTERK
jgi:NitT/TauT family transport system permease protein